VPGVHHLCIQEFSKTAFVAQADNADNRAGGYFYYFI
jgi:hypothetical protein